MDGFRFDLASILTRAPSAWHVGDWTTPEDTTEPVIEEIESSSDSGISSSDNVDLLTTPLEFEPTAIHSSGAIVCEAGFMTDGAGVPTGTPLADPPVIEMISEDPLLRNTKMIAEAWDCDGLKQVRTSEAFLSEISATSPRKLCSLSVYTCIHRIKVSDKTFYLVLKNTSLVHTSLRNYLQYF